METDVPRGEVVGTHRACGHRGRDGVLGPPEARRAGRTCAQSLQRLLSPPYQPDPCLPANRPWGLLVSSNVPRHMQGIRR